MADPLSEEQIEMKAVEVAIEEQAKPGPEQDRLIRAFLAGAQWQHEIHGRLWAKAFGEAIR